MAIIPETERRKLESSVVGTAGVDTSGQQIFNSISQTAGQVQDATMRFAAERQNAKDTAYANREGIELDRDLEKLLRTHQQDYSEFRGDKAERIKAFEESAQKMFQDRAAGITSRRAKELFEQRGVAELGRKLKKEDDIAEKNQVVLAHNDLVSSANTLAQRAADIWGDINVDWETKLADTQQVILKGEETFKTSKILFDPETQEKFRKAIPEMIMRGAIAGGTEKNPEQILLAANSGAFNQILTPEEIKRVKDDAQAAFPRVREQVELENTMVETQSHLDLWTAFKSGDKTVLQKLEQMPDTTFTKKLREMVLKGTADPTTSAETIVRLQTNFNKFMDKEQKNVKSHAKLEELRGFMNDVIEARTQGNLTDSQADTFLKKIAQPMFDRIKNGRSENWAWSNGGLYAQGYKTIDAWVTKNKLKKDSDIKAAVYLDFIDLMEAEAEPTKEVMIKRANEAVDRFVRGTNPSVGLMRTLPDKILKSNDEVIEATPVQKDNKKDVPVTDKANAKNSKRRIKSGNKVYDEWLDKEGNIIERKEVKNA